MFPQGRAVCPHCFHDFSKPVYLIVIGWKTYFRSGTWPVAGSCLYCGELLLTALLIEGEYDAVHPERRHRRFQCRELCERPAPAWENWAASRIRLMLFGTVVILATLLGWAFWAWRG